MAAFLVVDQALRNQQAGSLGGNVLSRRQLLQPSPSHEVKASRNQLVLEKAGSRTQDLNLRKLGRELSVLAKRHRRRLRRLLPRSGGGEKSPSSLMP